MSKLKLFALSVSLTAGVLLTFIYLTRSAPRSRPPSLVPVGQDLFITSQLSPDNLRYLKRRGVITVVDLRPDGEEQGQPSSSEIEAASKNIGLTFFYIPVPHENIPDNAVDALRIALSHEATPAVLYCHSGRRAARTLALAEASRADGPNCDAIMETVRRAGFTADDLRDNIAQRISQRNDPPAEKKDERATPTN